MMSFTLEFTETPQDSGCLSGSFDIDSSLVNSTPLSDRPNLKRKFEDTFEIPQLSSTHNDSLVSGFKNIRLGNSSFASAPNTPKKQMIYRDKVGSQTASPLEESRRILYSAGLKSRSAVKKTCFPSSPMKREKLKHTLKNRDLLLKEIASNPIIMNNIFKYLSDGSLYRLSQVSTMFLRAIESNTKARDRFRYHRQVYKENKENCLIPTPPSSPEKCDSPPRSSSHNFNIFVKSGRHLNRFQSQVPCPKCSRPCMVENNIGQCGNFNVCGYIYCLICSSFSETGPQDFNDKCGGSVLKNVSNQISSETSMYSNTLSFSKQDSGFYSEIETPPLKKAIRKQLFQGSETPKAFAMHNSQGALPREKRQEKKNFAQVVANKKRALSGKYDSPPNSPLKGDFVACSKKSKKNLKRLTF